MKRIKKTEDIVLDVLENNLKARQDDFILYGAVLKRLGVDLKQTLYEFLAKAKENKMPSFETVTRVRRKLCENNDFLIDKEIFKHRKNKENDFIEYSRS